MENLKVKISSEAESKEAQELFFELGAKPRSIIENWKNEDYKVAWFALGKSGELFNEVVFRGSDSGISYSSMYKEITLPELRDIVVLKRNDVGDATHESHCGELKFILLGDWWNLFTGGKWQQFSHKQSPRCNKLKPIEKPMKEYLDKQQDGTYKLIKADGGCIDRDWIEIPEGAIKAYLNNSKTINFINANDDYMNHVTKGEWVSTHRGMHEKCGHVLVWSRHTHPEELPFIDDECYTNKSDGGFRLPNDEPRVDTYKSEFGIEPPISLNDQYAEIEKVRQSAWQKQEGGSHYKNLKIQPMQYALENKLDYAQANVVKYVTRHKEKNGKEDLLKAIHNLELMIEFYYGDEK